MSGRQHHENTIDERWKQEGEEEEEAVPSEISTAASSQQNWWPSITFRCWVRQLCIRYCCQNVNGIEKDEKKNGNKRDQIGMGQRKKNKKKVKIGGGVRRGKGMMRKKKAVSKNQLENMFFHK